MSAHLSCCCCCCSSAAPRCWHLDHYYFLFFSFSEQLDCFSSGPSSTWRRSQVQSSGPLLIVSYIFRYDAARRRMNSGWLTMPILSSIEGRREVFLPGWCSFLFFSSLLPARKQIGWEYVGGHWPDPKRDQPQKIETDSIATSVDMPVHRLCPSLPPTLIDVQFHWDQLVSHYQMLPIAAFSSPRQHADLKRAGGEEINLEKWSFLSLSLLTSIALSLLLTSSGSPICFEYSSSLSEEECERTKDALITTIITHID